MKKFRIVQVLNDYGNTEYEIETKIWILWLPYYLTTLRKVAYSYPRLLDAQAALQHIKDIESKPKKVIIEEDK